MVSKWIFFGESCLSTISISTLVYRGSSNMYLKTYLVQQKKRILERKRYTENLLANPTPSDLPKRLEDRRKISLPAHARALEKISEGTYGICDDCGGEIDVKRLDKMPSSRYCIECADIHDVSVNRRGGR